MKGILILTFLISVLSINAQEQFDFFTHSAYNVMTTDNINNADGLSLAAGFVYYWDYEKQNDLVLAELSYNRVGGTNLDGQFDTRKFYRGTVGYGASYKRNAILAAMSLGSSPQSDQKNFIEAGLILFTQPIQIDNFNFGIRLDAFYQAFGSFSSQNINQNSPFRFSGGLMISYNL